VDGYVAKDSGAVDSMFHAVKLMLPQMADDIRLQMHPNRHTHTYINKHTHTHTYAHTVTLASNG